MRGAAVAALPRLAVLWLLPFLLAACFAQSGPDGDLSAFVAAARRRPAPDSARVRVKVQVDSPLLDLGGISSGGLQLDGPGAGKLVFFGPMGATTAILQSDGRALSASLTRRREHYLARDGEPLLREITGGSAGVGDLLALLVGELPLAEAAVRDTTPLDDGAVLVTLVGPDGCVVEAELDGEEGRPRRVVLRDPQRSLLLQATYSGWVELDGRVVPDGVVLGVPALELVITFRYLEWTRAPRPDVEAPPGQELDLSAPDGYAQASLADAVLQGIRGLRAP